MVFQNAATEYPWELRPPLPQPHTQDNPRRYREYHRAYVYINLLCAERRGKKMQMRESFSAYDAWTVVNRLIPAIQCKRSSPTLGRSQSKYFQYIIT